MIDCGGLGLMSDYNPYEFVTVPSGWKCKTLIDCTEDENISYGIVQPGQHVNDGIPVIRVNNVNHGQLDLTNVLKVSPEVEIKYKRTRLKGGEVLLTLVGSTGQSFVAPKEFENWNVPRAIAVIRAKEEIGADWINLCLQSQETKHFLDVRANTTVQKTLNLKDVRDIPILIPPKHVKCSIENMALSLANKIELNRRMNKVLEEMAQAIFKNWFVDFEPVKAKVIIREKGGNELAQALAAQAIIAGTVTLEQLGNMEFHPLGWNDVLHPLVVKNFEPMGLDYWVPEQLKSLAKLFPNALTESELGEIPEGWGVDGLGSISDIIMGQSLKGDTYNDLGEGMSLVNGPVEFGEYHPCSNKWTTKPTKLSKAGDLIVCVRGSTTGRYVKSDAEYCLGRGVCAIRSNDYQPYVDQLFKSELNKLLSLTTGSTFPSWTGPTLKQYKVIVPSVESMAAYSELMQPKLDFISNNTIENENLSSVRDALLPKLLSGELSLDSNQVTMEVEQ